MYTMKDGTQVSDIRLGRLAQFDERSRQYPIRQWVKGEARKSYTWPRAKVLDQGPDGACVGFSMAHELIAAPKTYKEIDYKQARDFYWMAQKIDPWAGGAYPGATPFYEGTSILAGVKVLKAAGYIDEYRWAFGVADLAVAVARFGPAVIGINWYTGMYNTDSEGFVHVTGQIAGGHAIMVRGYSNRTKTFRLTNSWGDWGVDGDCFVSYNDMDRLLREQGEAVIPVKRNFERDINA